jgi:hypothetical protein
MLNSVRPFGGATVQIHKLTTRCRSALPVKLFRPAELLVTSASMSGLVLTPVAVLAVVLGAWRFGAAPGWTNDFAIADGLLSRYQLWFAIAIGAETSGFFLNRWVAKRKLNSPAPAPRRSPL